MISYKYVLKKPLPDEFKIRVTPEQSEAVQKELVNQGKTWISGGSKIHLLKYKVLFYKNNTFMVGNDIDWPKTHDCIEIMFQDYFGLEFAKTVSPMDEAISNLETQVKGLTTTLTKWKETNLLTSENGESVGVKLPKDTDPRILLYQDMLNFAATENGDWQTDWEEQNLRYGIVYGFETRVEYQITMNYFVFGISFREKESAKKALEIFKDRIIKYYGK